MRKLFLFCFMFMLLALPKLSFAEEEELAPGFNLCMHSATSAYFMMQCGNDAYAYWEEKLHNRHKLLRSICSSKESQDRGIQKECTETFTRLEKSSNEYRDSMRNFVYLLSDDEDGKMSDLDALALKIDVTKQQVKNFAILPSFASLDAAENMFKALVILWEAGGVQSFDTLTDEILDEAVMTVWNTGYANLDWNKYLTPGNKPEIFKGNNAEYDIALHRTEAAKIAQIYFGKSAPLKNIKGDYLYGMQADGPIMCKGRIDDAFVVQNGFALRGALLCMDSPMEEKEVHTADMEVVFKENMDYFMGENGEDLPRVMVHSVKIQDINAE